MKIVLITLHRVTNFGSMLQSYALMRALQKSGHNVEILDFVPRGLQFKSAIFPANDQRSIVKKAIRLIPALYCNIVEYAVMNRFLRRHHKVTRRRYENFDHVVKNLPMADAYICGSDQIWNTQNNNLPDDLRVYYLDLPVKDGKKIAYAASFGRDAFTDEEKQKIMHWLSSFAAISVREDTAIQTLNEMGIHDAEHVLDPTFLIDAEEWKSFISKRNPQKGYVFVYNLNRNIKLKKIALSIAKEKDLRIVNFASTFEFVKGGQNRMVNNPIDFLRYIANAEYVVTDSFHGIALSINLNRPFICVPAPAYNCRLESLLRLLGLSHRLIKGDIPDHVLDAVGDMDYDQINRILEQEKRKSRDFLNRALEGQH